MTSNRAMLRCLVLCLPGLLSWSQQASAEDKHMGVATCASTVCHGNATAKPDANILHSEYVFWGQQDPHANTFQTLLSAESARIANKLGLGRADQAPVCLACHSDYVPEAQRGDRFQLNDGVGCEACHGGAGRWLTTHTEKGVSHADNVAQGLRPLEDPSVKAQVCQGCHIGMAGKFAGHDIMGAGHPRLQFELANYSAALPEHHRIDEDYRARKQVATELQLFSEGQLQAALNTLDGLASKRFDRAGLFPELAFFDCHACHQPMNPVNWQQRALSSDLPAGAVRLNDSALIMATLLWKLRNPGAAENWQQGVRALHRSSQKGVEPVQKVAALLRDQVEAMLRDYRNKPLSVPEAQRLARSMVAYSRDQAFNDYMTAEQITMALNVMLRNGGVANPDALQPPLDALYDSLDDQHNFHAWKFRQAMDRFSGVMR